MFIHTLPQRFARKPLPYMLAALLGGVHSLALAADTEQTLAVVMVSADEGRAQSTEQSGLYTTRKSASASKLDLSLRETPQTVSVLSRTLLDDFGITNVNDALALSSGIVVERVETDRTYYTARGFDVTNFQVDGVGMPFIYENVEGDIDVAIYDRIDAVYGANGLMAGTGMPSAAINFVRKRPTAALSVSAAVTAGSWQSYRAETDVAGPLNESGSVRGRLVAVGDTAGSYLDRYGRDKAVFYGIVEADLTERSKLALGLQHQSSKTDSPLWGALPLIHSDGSPADYPVSTSTASDWSWWNTKKTTGFAELEHHFNDDWSGKLTLTQSKFSSDSELFYVYGTPDPVTGLGLLSYPSAYSGENKQQLADLGVSGKFELGGRRHELSFGGSWGKSVLDDRSDYGRGIGTALPPLDGWNGDYPKPPFDASTDGSHFRDLRNSLYLATRLNLADPLKVIAGTRWTRVDISGMSYGVARETSASKATPYIGAIYDLSTNLSLYASHTRIFDPQHEIDRSGNVLQPVEGKSSEIGLKGEFLNKTLNASLALFKTEQRNLAEQAGYNGPKAYYKGIDADSQGVQVDVSGQLAADWQASIGYTGLSLESPDGKDVRTYVPRNLLRLATTYRLPFAPAFKVGGSLSWQDDIKAVASSGTIRQDGYALLNLMARYDFDEQFSATLNINNVSDEKYVSSLYWGSNGQGFYGAPRNASIRLSWKY